MLRCTSFRVDGNRRLGRQHDKTINKRKHIKKLMDLGAFDYVVILGNGTELGRIKEIQAVSEGGEL